MVLPQGSARLQLFVVSLPVRRSRLFSGLMELTFSEETLCSIVVHDYFGFINALCGWEHSTIHYEEGDFISLGERYEVAKFLFRQDRE